MNNAAIKRIALAGSLAAGLVAAAVLFCFDPARVPIYPRCRLYQLTGLACPSCGSLRALHALLHGHLAAAWHLNAFLILSLPILAGLGIRLAWREINGQPAPPMPLMWLWLYLGAWLVFGCLRNLFFPL